VACFVRSPVRTKAILAAAQTAVRELQQGRVGHEKVPEKAQGRTESGIGHGQGNEGNRLSVANGND